MAKKKDPWIEVVRLGATLGERWRVWIYLGDASAANTALVETAFNSKRAAKACAARWSKATGWKVVEK